VWIKNPTSGDFQLNLLFKSHLWRFFASVSEFSWTPFPCQTQPSAQRPPWAAPQAHSPAAARANPQHPPGFPARLAAPGGCSHAAGCSPSAQPVFPARAELLELCSQPRHPNVAPATALGRADGLWASFPKHLWLVDPWEGICGHHTSRSGQGRFPRREVAVALFGGGRRKLFVVASTPSAETCCTVVKEWVRGAPRLGILLLCSLLWRVSCFYNLHAFKTKGFFFYTGKICTHMLIITPTPLRLLLKLSCVPRLAQLQLLPRTTRSRGAKLRAHPKSCRRLCAQRLRLPPQFPQDGGLLPSPRADPNDSAAAISAEALMQMKNLLIILQGKVLDLNVHGFGAPVPHSWLSGASLVSTHCREHQSVLDRRPAQPLERDP